MLNEVVFCLFKFLGVEFFIKWKISILIMLVLLIIINYINGILICIIC